MSSKKSRIKTRKLSALNCHTVASEETPLFRFPPNKELFDLPALLSTPHQSTPKSARTRGSQRTPVLTPAGQSRVIGVFLVTPARTPAHPLAVPVTLLLPPTPLSCRAKVFAAWSSGNTPTTPAGMNIPSGSGVQKAVQASPAVLDNKKMLEYVTNKQVHTLTLQPLKSSLKGKIDKVTSLKQEALVAAVYYNLD
ncbi:uncharacterized protein LOC127750783 [Frankliniella occidentalis]|uniref:Uncharacterized protein LOC127750783 n=1 Tax=Frankliniella occidentalis TaxID=133901 RepID=A0A9C6X4W2_FRAOC|nr:uncharacterized protein LOC127750783 [Frankliniella occidentalis]